MNKLLVPLSVAMMLIGAMFVALSTARGQSIPGQEQDVILQSETQGGNTRQLTGPDSTVLGSDSPDQVSIGFIDSPTAACVQPDHTKNECYINWYYLSVSADPNYMITMTVSLNEYGFVARYSGFFQTSMYVPYNMNPQGYKVECGLANSGGSPYWGNAYAYTIRARDSAGLKSANYGTAYCPPYIP